MTAHVSPTRRSRLRTWVAIGLVALISANCSGSDGDKDASDPTQATTAPESEATTAAGQSVLQELWIVARLEAIDLDGNLVDLLPSLREMVASSAADPVELSSKATFSPAPDFAVSMVDAEGVRVDSVAVLGGIVQNAAGQAVAFVATPAEGRRRLGNGHLLRFALPSAPAVPHGTPLVADYAYAQVRPTAGERATDPTGALDLFSHRMRSGAVATFLDDDGNSLIATGEIGMTRSTASGVEESADQPRDEETSSGDLSSLGSNELGGVSPMRMPADAPSSGRTSGDTQRVDRLGQLRSVAALAAAQDSSDDSSGEGDSSSDSPSYREVLEKAKDIKDTAEDTKDAVDEVLDAIADPEGFVQDQMDGAIDDLGDAVKDKAVDKASDVADIPAEVRPITDGIGEGLAGCSGLGPECVKDVLDGVEDGANEALQPLHNLDDSPDGSGSGGSDGNGSSGSDGNGSSGSNGNGSGGSNGNGSSGSNGNGSSGSNGNGSSGSSDDGGEAGACGGANAVPGRGCCVEHPTAANCAGAPDPEGNNDNGTANKPSSSWFFAEPHVRTFDGVRYDLQLPGEFIGANTAGLEVQVRIVPVACGCPVSVVGAVAIGDGEHRVFVDRADARLIAVDGERVDLDVEELVEAGSLRIERTRGGLRVIGDDATEVSIDISPDHLDVLISPSDGRTWTGLLGSRNGDPDDEFRTRDGEDLGPTPGREAIDDVFVESWRIAQEESLFEYGPGETTETFSDAPFPRPNPDLDLRRLVEVQLRRRGQAEAVCALAGITDPDLLSDCAFDFQVTGNVSFVNAARSVERRALPRPTSESPTVGSEPITLASVRLAEISGADLATGAGLVLMRTLDADDRVTLSAIDIGSRTVRWTAHDVDRSCRPVVVDGLGVVAQVAPGTERLGSDRSALVLLSLEDGSELARFVGDGDDVLDRCAAALNATGDVVIHIAHNEARGFRIGDDIKLLWRHELEGPVGGHSPGVDGHFVVTSFLSDKDAGVALTSLDAETGEVASSITIPGRQVRSSPAAIEPIGDGLVAISTNGNSNVDPALALVDASGGRLDVIWVQTYGDGDDAPVTQVVRLGDQLVGWTDRGRGAQLAGFSIKNGERVWAHVPESPPNPPGLVVAAGENTAVISAYSLAWLEFVNGDDQTSRLVDLPDGYSEPRQITVVGEHTVVVTGATVDGGVYLEFVDL